MKTPTFSPGYVALFPMLAEVAQANGYALCVHGSVGRDFDLVAAPWTDEAVDSETLFLAIAKQCQVSTGKIIDPVLTGVTESVDKPHGRRAWSILLGFGAVIDLSVMPRLEAAQPAAGAVDGMSAERFIEYIDKERGNQVWSQDLLLLAQAFDAYHEMKSRKAVA